MNYNFDHESDSETIQQTETIQQPIVTLEYLLNQNKMKEIALGKATHLIELYKIELQVKEQDYLKEIEIVRQTEKENYQAVITELQEKILDLERQLRTQQTKIKDQQRIISQNEHLLRQQQYKLRQKVKVNDQIPSTEKLNDSGCMIPKIIRNSSGKNLGINNNRRMSTSQSKTIIHHKNNSFSNVKPHGQQQGQQQYMKRSHSGMISHNNNNDHQQQYYRQQQIYRIEKSFLIDYLLRTSQKDQHIISQLQNTLSFQLQYFNELKSTMKGNDKFMQGFIKVLKQPSLEIENKLRHYQQVVKIQQLIIEQLNGQLNEYQHLFHTTNTSIIDIFQSQTVNNLQSPPFYTHQNSNNSFQQFRDIIDQIHISTHDKIKQHKNFIKQKIQNMETQNKELKRILEDMIKLIKNNKKINSIALTNQKGLTFATANESATYTTNNKHERPSSFSQNGNSKVSAFGYENERQHHHGNMANNLKVSQDVSMSRDKISSQIIYRK